MKWFIEWESGVNETIYIWDREVIREDDSRETWPAEWPDAVVSACELIDSKFRVAAPERLK